MNIELLYTVNFVFNENGHTEILLLEKDLQSRYGYFLLFCTGRKEILHFGLMDFPYMEINDLPATMLRTFVQIDSRR